MGDKFVYGQTQTRRFGTRRSYESNDVPGFSRHRHHMRDSRGERSSERLYAEAPQSSAMQDGSCASVVNPVNSFRDIGMSIRSGPLVVSGVAHHRIAM